MTTILLVDDEAPNRAIMRRYLANSGHTIVEASSGEQALALAAQQPPDLVLLDVIMPGLDGYEVTRRLKAMAGEAFLPVVLVSGLTDQVARRQGLAAGADDFVSKPVDPQELVVRVRNLLSLRAKERALSEQNLELSELHRFKKEINALLIHDLKSPLAVSLMCLEHALSTCRCGGETREALDDALLANTRLKAMITNVLDIDRLESARLAPMVARFDTAAWAESILSARRWEATQREIAIDNRIGVGTEALGDPALLARVLDNLIDNALRYTPRKGRIVLSVTRDALGTVSVRVGNTGTPIPENMRTKIFEKYGQVDASFTSTNGGFGLYFCMLALEAHGGRIYVEETPELGTVFVLDLPATGSQRRVSTARARTRVPGRRAGSSPQR